MRKKFTLLIMTAILLLAGAGGKMYGQIYWGDGCGCGATTYDYSISTSLEDGIDIDGLRYTYWFAGVYSTASQPPGTVNGTCGSTTYPSSGTYRRSDAWVHYYYTRNAGSTSCCTSYSCGPLNDECCSSVYYTYTRQDVTISYPSNIPADCSLTGLIPNSFQYTDPTHNHGPINVTVSGGAIYEPNHYAHFHFLTPEWQHRRHTFSYTTPPTNNTNGNSGSWTTTPTTTTSGYVQDGTIIISAGASVRLHDATAIQYNNSGTNALSSTHALSLPVNFYMRFDALFTGLNGVALTTSANNLTTINNAAKGLGFFNGVTAANAVTLQNGYLFLGSNRNNQYFTVNATNNVFIENYYRSADLADNSVNLHDLAIDFQTPTFSLNSYRLNVSNSNSCYDILVYNTFAPTGIATSSGGIYIGVNGAGAGGTRGGGTTRFYSPVEFLVGATSTTNVTAPIRIYGGNVIFESAATYDYDGSAELHQIWAHEECDDGDILFLGGAIAVTKSGGNTEWTAERDIETSVGSTVDYTISNASETYWEAGRDITTNDEVTFTLSGSGITQWLAANNITSLACTNTITFTHTGTGPTFWEAGGDIDISPTVIFTKANLSNGYTEWKAGGDISTHNDVTFTSSLNTATTGTRGAKWDAGDNINVDQSCALPNKTVAFTNESPWGDFMWWLAGANINVTGSDPTDRITVEFENQALNNSSTTNYMKWEAGDDIDINFAYIDFTTKGDGTNTGNGTTDWWAGRHILMENTSVNFDYELGAGATNWYAGQNITALTCGEIITFTHTGTGTTGWRANMGSIFVAPEVEFTKTNVQNGYTQWYARNNITTTNNVTFTSNNNTATTGLRGTQWWAEVGSITANDACGPVTVEFTNNSPADDYMWWLAGANINVTGTTTTRQIEVYFTNNATSTTDSLRNYMRWEAGDDIDIRRADIYFLTEDASRGHTEWNAGNDILMLYSNIDFQDYGTGTNANTLWMAGNDIHATQSPITILNENETAGGITPPVNGYTWWTAGNDIILQDNSVTSITTNNASVTQEVDRSDWVKLEGGRDIRTGINSPLLIEHNTDANFEMYAHSRNMWLQSPTDILNTGVNNNSLLWAGKHILIDSVFTYQAIDPAGITSVVLHAHTGNIETNTNSVSYNPDDRIRENDPCLGPRAYVNFTLLGPGYTEWWAGNSIISNDTISFHYDNTGSTIGDLVKHADIGNIDLRRILNIDYDSENLIRWEALAQHDPTRRANKHSIADIASLTCYNGIEHANIGAWGNIRTSDSVIINRTYTGSIQGRTQIDAYNDIQTAMFNFTSVNPAGENTSITSRMGDIWLGYSHTNPVYCSSNNVPSNVGFDLNRFVYNIPVVTSGGLLSIRAGFDDINATGTPKYDGGNIYFTHIVDSVTKGGINNTEIAIPFSNMFTCNNLSSDKALWGCDYERAGIIGGVWRCQSTATGIIQCTDTGLIHVGNRGNLLVDAGSRGNIIINNGVFLNFQDDGGPNEGNARFLTQKGDIDMRNKFNAERMQGNLLFYANSLLPNKLLFDPCGCDERMNNVYLQDFWYTPVPKAVGNSGSVFIGADNNIKLQYGGLQTIGTQFDPFYNSLTYECAGGDIHCDSDTTINQARNLVLDFGDTNSGGFAAVASDLIDIYKKTYYYGGSGSGMGSVPGYTTLHGENVAGYGLFIKSQGNKQNWTKNPFKLEDVCEPDCPGGCEDAYLHQVARVTFHDEARIFTHNSRAYIGGPVVESYGHLELNTDVSDGSRTSLRVQTDSLIVHDDFIIDGPKLRIDSWSGLYRDMPVIKFGHQRFTPPFAETDCANCRLHEPGMPDKLDTISVSFRNNATLPRLHTLVADHTVLTLKTDSFDHVPGNPDLDAKIFTDTFKIRNQVELWGNASRTYTGHFELISEQQMYSKDYAGIYARHLHMEPILPDCKRNGYSDLWIQENFLDVITSSTFGGFGTIHSNVHVEIKGKLAPGYTSLGISGNCYEQMAGTLTMQNLTLDAGAELHFSVGHKEGLYGELVDVIAVDNLHIYGSVPIYVEKRCQQTFKPGCYPIILYNSLEQEDVLNHIQLGTQRIDGYTLALDFSEPGIVNLCIGSTHLPVVQREVVILQPPAGVSVNPPPGVHYVPWGYSFVFTLAYDGPQYLIQTNRLLDNGDNETLRGVRNANGEYEYTIPFIKTQPLYVYIGPTVSVPNEYIDKDAIVWSYGNTLYIKVEEQDIASIYSVTGMLVQRIEVPEGGTSLPMQRGVFIVTLKDGSVHRIIIR